MPDLQFAEAARAYLERLKEDGQLVAYRITRCKLGLAPPNLREWHIDLPPEEWTPGYADIASA